jgi:hypothetical protein
MGCPPGSVAGAESVQGCRVRVCCWEYNRSYRSRNKSAMTKSADRLLLCYGAFALAVVGVGAGLFAVGDLPGSWFLVLVIAFVVFGSITFGQIVIARRRLVSSLTADSVKTEGHGRTEQDLAMPRSSEVATQGVTRRWVGAATIPGSVGWVSATTPLGVLEVVNNTLILRLRPRFIQSMFGTKVLSTTAADGVIIYPARKFSMRGVAVQVPDFPAYYFWGRDADDVLQSLGSAGFEVSSEERRLAGRQM